MTNKMLATVQSLLAEENKVVQSIEDAMAAALSPKTYPKVEATLSIFEQQWKNTAELCLFRAAEMEAAAAELRERAANLQGACTYIQDVRGAVSYEIESRTRADSLALVNPPSDG